ncbi:MAG: hypothetical protein Q4B60_04305 [Erysipelotrichaceae bacterium]|nr:hypothetical protein [Erysipelotrichaceae bacterium]
MQEKSKGVPTYLLMELIDKELERRGLPKMNFVKGKGQLVYIPSNKKNNNKHK